MQPLWTAPEMWSRLHRLPRCPAWYISALRCAACCAVVRGVSCAGGRSTELGALCLRCCCLALRSCCWGSHHASTTRGSSTVAGRRSLVTVTGLYLDALKLMFRGMSSPSRGTLCMAYRTLRPAAWDCRLNRTNFRILQATPSAEPWSTHPSAKKGRPGHAPDGVLRPHSQPLEAWLAAVHTTCAPAPARPLSPCLRRPTACRLYW